MMKRTYHFAHFQTDLLLCDEIAQLAAQNAQAALQPDLIVADRNTAPLLAAATDLKADIVLEPGEASKCLAQVEAIIALCAERRLSRGSTILAFGGGVLCDLTGFAAASYMRGCGLILVPTTLLSMVDASLGGKTGCNYCDYKNMIGAFYPAREVYIVPEVLKSLPPRQFRSGLAELCKHALLSDTTQLYDALQGAENRALLQGLCSEGTSGASGASDASSSVALAGNAALREILFEGVHVKGQIVERDLYERGERAFLNLGHTFGHALEKISGFACTHGEAVAWGIHQALGFSAAFSYCSEAYAQQAEALLRGFGFELDLAVLCPDLWRSEAMEPLMGRLVRAMELDKKRDQDGIRLVLQRGRGQSFVQNVSAQQIEAFLCSHVQDLSCG